MPQGGRHWSLGDSWYHKQTQWHVVSTKKRESSYLSPECLVGLAFVCPTPPPPTFCPSTCGIGKYRRTGNPPSTKRFTASRGFEVLMRATCPVMSHRRAWVETRDWHAPHARGNRSGADEGQLGGEKEGSGRRRSRTGRAGKGHGAALCSPVLYSRAPKFYSLTTKLHGPGSRLTGGVGGAGPAASRPPGG